ncbi:MAG: hypothetical protein N3C60_04440 [Calditerrivibrio sp.]|nr:hypothetical protein [Calditerrivibrio sp.]
MTKHISLPYPNENSEKGFDLFPIFLDFDFQNFLPRGITAKIDLLNPGKMYSCISKIKKPKEIIYVLKHDLCFEKGFFLIDFLKLSIENDKYITLLKDFEHHYLYFEKSNIIDFKELSDRLNKHIFVVEFL